MLDCGLVPVIARRLAARLATVLLVALGSGAPSLRADSSLDGLHAAPVPYAFTLPPSPPMAPEAPPWPLDVPGAPPHAFLMPTAYAVIALSSQTLAATAVTVESGATVTRIEPEKPWAHSYNGAWTAFTADAGLPTQRIYFGEHGENKNEILAIGATGKRTPLTGTVGHFPITESDPNSWSGYDANGKYHDGYAAYFQFVTMSYVDSNPRDGYGLTSVATDLGPIVWPTGGYLTPTGARAGGGVGQPTFYSDGTYVYVYYRDDSVHNGDDGEFVARAKIADLQTASDADKPRKFLTWCGTKRGWLPSLPDGFDKSDIAAFWAKPGPPAAPVRYRHRFRGRLAVAKVNGKNYYLGVGESSQDGATWVDELVKSTDLLNWTTVGVLSQGSAYDRNVLNYPTLMNSAGIDPFNIDEDDFYVLGSYFGGNASAGKMRIRHLAIGAP